MHTEKFCFDLPRGLYIFFNILACIMFAHISQQRVALFKRGKLLRASIQLNRVSM